MDSVAYLRFGKKVEGSVAKATSTETDAAKTQIGRAGQVIGNGPSVHKDKDDDDSNCFSNLFLFSSTLFSIYFFLYFYSYKT